MTTDRNGAALRSLHALFAAGTVGGLTDGQLLERFSTREGEPAELAFAALVERHGPMVLRVCRGVLRDGHDAEDAFQATFLILARKARSVRVRDTLGPWLHGVAYHVASTARSTISRRRSREREAAEMRPRVVAEGDRDDLDAVVHEELNRLPGRYRSAVVLCCLEGLTQHQAAQRLGWPLGTVQSRLARGREKLRVRLTRRGLAPLAGLPVAILGTEATRAAVPAALASATIRSATRFAAGRMAVGVVTASVASLTDGVLRTMALTKLMTVGVSGLLLTVVLTGAGLLAQSEGEPSRARRVAGNPVMKYEIRIWRDGKPTGEPVVAERTLGASVHIVTPDSRIDIRPSPKPVTQVRPAEDAATSDSLALPPADTSETSDSQTTASPRANRVLSPPPEEVDVLGDPSAETVRDPRSTAKDVRKKQGPPPTGMPGMGGMGSGMMPGMGMMGGMEGKPPRAEGMPVMMGGMMGPGGREGKPPVTEEMEGMMGMGGRMPGMGPGGMDSGMRMGGNTLDQRMTEMERKLDRILRTLEGSKETKDSPLIRGPGRQ